MRDAFLASVKAAHPDAFFACEDVRNALAIAKTNCSGRVLVLGAGKAAAAMATALERAWQGELTGLVITRAGYETPTDHIEVALGGHPHPEDQSTEIAKRMLALASELTADDLLIGLWSGGGSALLACPPDDVPFEMFRMLTKDLLTSGADICAINSVRKHFSQIAGGQLAVAAGPAHLLNLIIPDVVSEQNDATLLSAIASGPTVPDPTTHLDALHVLEQRKMDVAPALKAHLSDAGNETPKTWAGLSLASHTIAMMEPDVAVDAATGFFDARGFALAQASAEITGEAKEVAKHHAEFACSIAKSGTRAVIITGGELTVNVTGSGTGGPNQEYALALAIALEGAKGICALAADTDGIDGIGDAAGAFVFPDTLSRLRNAGVKPSEALANNDAGSAFAAIGDLLITGPTFTNVNDLRLIVING